MLLCSEPQPFGTALKRLHLIEVGDGLPLVSRHKFFGMLEADALDHAAKPRRLLGTFWRYE